MGYKNNEIFQTSLYDRVKKLLVSYEWSDCRFSVGEKDFKAHKLILGISSPVFEAMFYGPLASNDDIVITDIEPDTFQLLLNYIYTDKVEITSIEEAFELLYASKKYLLEHLTDTCITYIQANISVDNVVTILNYPEFMQDKELVSTSLKLFCEHASFLLQENKAFLSPSCMKTVLEHDHINIEEKDLIKYVFEWTIRYCEQSKISKDIQNRRDVLVKNNLLKLLRFSVLTSEEFQEIISNENNLLLPHEIEHITEVTNKGNEEKNTVDSVDVILTPRNTIKVQWNLCQRSPVRSVAPIIINTHNFMLCCRVKANKSVFVNSLCVPSRMAPVLNFYNNTLNVYSEQISISVVSESDNSVVKFTNFMNTVEYDSMINIELSAPCLIKKDNWYKVSFKWPQNRFISHSYITECRDRCYNDQKVTFEFDDVNFTGHCGSFLAGLKYCL